MYNVIILFGVSGCGKSLIGNQLSKDLQFKFIEADDFHSNENIKKMKKTFLSWTLMTLILSISGLIFTVILSLIF
jgi:shikimate kinase